MASLTESQIRNSVKSRYPNRPNWYRQVDRMSKEQVYAIYMRFEEEDSRELVERNDKQLSLF